MIKKCDSCGDRFRIQSPVRSNNRTAADRMRGISRRKQAEMDEQFPRTEELDEECEDDKTAAVRPSRSRNASQNVKTITAQLDDIAEHLKKSGKRSLAFRLDKVSNTLEAMYNK